MKNVNPVKETNLERAVKETKYINSIPGLADSIIKGGKEKLEECLDEVDWNKK